MDWADGCCALKVLRVPGSPWSSRLQPQTRKRPPARPPVGRPTPPPRIIWRSPPLPVPAGGSRARACESENVRSLPGCLAVTAAQDVPAAGHGCGRTAWPAPECPRVALLTGDAAAQGRVLLSAGARGEHDRAGETRSSSGWAMGRLRAEC